MKIIKKVLASAHPRSYNYRVLLNKLIAVNQRQLEIWFRNAFDEIIVLVNDSDVLMAK